MVGRVEPSLLFLSRSNVAWLKRDSRHLVRLSLWHDVQFCRSGTSWLSCYDWQLCIDNMAREDTKGSIHHKDIIA